MYSSHNSNIKCVNLIIKGVGFEPNVVSSSMISSDLDPMFLLNN